MGNIKAQMMVIHYSGLSVCHLSVRPMFSRQLSWQSRDVISPNNRKVRIYPEFTSLLQVNYEVVFERLKKVTLWGIV